MKTESLPCHLNLRQMKNISITFTRVILSICCTESYCTCWEKGIKYASPSAKGFLRVFFGIHHHQKGYLVYVPHTSNIISSYDVVFDNIFLVRWHIRHNNMKRRWLYDWMCHTHLMLHLQGGKLAI